MVKQVFRYRWVLVQDGETCHSEDEYRFSRKPNKRGEKGRNVSLCWLIAVYKLEVPEGTTRARTFSEDIRMRIPGLNVNLDASQMANSAERGDTPLIKLLERKRIEPPEGWEAEARGAEGYYIGEDV